MGIITVKTNFKFYRFFILNFIYINNYMNNNNYIPTKKKNIKYTFVQPRDNTIFDIEPTGQINFFYQVCSFPDPYTKKFHMRKFVINENNEFIDVKEYNLSKKQAKKFFNEKKPNEYKCYSVYNLKNVDYPIMSDVLMAKSDILSTNYDYTGFAPF